MPRLPGNAACHVRPVACLLTARGQSGWFIVVYDKVHEQARLRHDVWQTRRPCDHERRSGLASASAFSFAIRVVQTSCTTRPSSSICAPSHSSSSLLTR